MLKNERVLAYSEENKKLGTIAMMNFEDSEVSLIDTDGELFTTSFEDLTELPLIGELNGVTLFDRDVIQLGTEFYLVKYMGEGKAQMQLLKKLKDASLEIVEGVVGETFEVAETSLILSMTSLELRHLGNYEVLQNEIQEEKEKKQKFNIKIFKDVEGVFFDAGTYFYAGNVNGVVDLIKVVFMGHNLLEEEAYERDTVAIETLLFSINECDVKEVTPSELLKYVSGKLSA